MAPSGDWPPSLRTAADICRNSPYPAFIFGADRAVQTNDACAALGARTALEIPAKGPVEWVLATGRPTTTPPFPLTTGHGERVRRGHARLHLTPVFDDGRVSGVYAAVAFIEETASEAQRANTAKSRFFAAASHDLRQPFQAMRLFLDTLKAQLADDDRCRSTADLLGKAMESGEVLLNALLDVSVLDAGTVKPKACEFDIADMLERLLGEFRPLAEEKGLELRARIQPVAVCTDPALFERIMRNLLANAIRYTRHGAVLVATRRRGATLRVEFWDTGFGIPGDQLQAIFEEFHQLENPERNRNRGLGLGLAIVQKVATLLGSPIEVRSQVGRGSVFAVTVPMTDHRRSERPAHAAPHATSFAGRTVLVVDDDELVLMGLRMVLMTWGCTVLAAADMAQALTRLDQLADSPDLILSDLRLRGGLSGLDVVDRVRRLFRREIPAVILTGETGEAPSVMDGHQRGHWLLHKPLEPHRLMAVLDEILGGGR